MSSVITVPPRNDSAGRAALLAFALTRVPILVVGYLAVRIVGVWPPPVEQAVWRVYESELWNLPARWDAYWYYSIATEGYQWSGNVLQHQSVVFFPLYPWLMRLGGAITGQPLLAGVAISLTAFPLALMYLYRLARLDLLPDQARTALLLLTFYPFSVFYGAPYTESVFLLEAVAAFYYLRRGDPVKAGLAGLLAGLTRPNGCVLAVPLMCVAMDADASWHSRALRLPRTWHRGLPSSLMPIVGVLLYSVYLYARFGHPFIWVKNQAAWGLAFLPHAPVVQDYGPHLTTPYASATVLVGNIIALVLAAWSILPIARRFGIAYALFVVSYMAPAFLTHAFTSAGRFTSVLFPIFLVLASEIVPSRRRLWIAVFGAGQVVAAAVFYTWRPLV
jgi:hypothetical protein